MFARPGKSPRKCSIASAQSGVLAAADRDVTLAVTPVFVRWHVGCNVPRDTRLRHHALQRAGRDALEGMRETDH
jgi:hypothetical protein